ncbi:EAL domain-containing protein [Shewanella gaetbuli]|uniref:EAL domain-containing protein n=1 Tax=Shewanella gaetbuli TaxID=220752 RepID=A0A9X1ZU49_9GAMM|nr:EAL domain-containing protein [Shewanella gaetbuli]MCL1142281.1 EAL domain-containing protein [Shewanella gaetbuli]
MKNIKFHVLFLSVLVISIMGFKAFDHFLARQIIARDAEILTEKFQKVIQDSIEQMEKLPDISSENFVCDDELIDILKVSVFDANFIRWMGITKQQTIYCESNAILRNIKDVQTHRISEDYSLGVVQLENTQSHELVLVRHVNDLFYTASIIPLEPRYFIPVECDKCLEYKLSFSAEPFLVFGFDNYDGINFVSEKTVLRSPYFEATFELSGNLDFYQQYNTISWVLILLLSIILASWITYVYWRWSLSSVSLHKQILQGVTRNEFIPFYQPIIDSRNQTLVGCEVLMRWSRPDGSLMPPNQFIPYAEDNGLIVAMTECMVEHMVKDIQTYGDAMPALFFSVNIVPDHLKNDDFFQLIKGYIDNQAFGKHRLGIEITERMPIDDLTQARSFLDKFYALGIELKLDDAGTGYGGFSYVQQLGISTLKIDKMFVDTIGHDDNFNAKTIEAIISFSKKSELDIIAEGVETQEQVDYLAQHKVYLIQGYFYSKPLDSRAFFKYKI